MSATSPRRRRRRVLALGPVRCEASPGGIDVEPVASVFEALGRIATCPARQPIEAVLVAASAPDDLHEVVRASEAIRRLDPTVQICLVSATPPHDHVSPHVDHHVNDPIEHDRLEAVLDGLPNPPSPLPEAVASSPERAKAADDAPHMVGDTDLLECLLDGRAHVISLALRAIEQRTGLTDLAFDPGGGGPDAVPVRRGLTTWGHLSGGDTDVLEPWAAWLARWIAVEDTVQSLQQEAHRDHLTGAWNRRAMETFLPGALSDARHMRREVTVFVFDIDDFKHFNDRFGHEAGDIILKAMVRLLSSVIREGDRVCRLGGDEFAVVFADSAEPREPGSRHPTTVDVLALRFQEQISNLRFPELGVHAPGKLTISGGLATFPWDGDDPETLLRVADQRAIASKRRGKNCLTVGSDDAQPPA